MMSKDIFGDYWKVIFRLNALCDTSIIASMNCKIRNYNKMATNDTCLMAILQDNPGKLVTECLHSGFYWSCG